MNCLKQLFLCCNTLFDCNLNHEQVAFIEKVKAEVHDIKDINQTDDNGQTLLHIAAKNGNLLAVKDLIKLKINSRIQDDNGATALHLASYCDHDQIVEFMLKNQQYNVLDEYLYGFTPVQMAAYKGNIKTIKVFFANKISNEKELEMFGCNNTPLHVACKYGQADIVKFLLEQHADKNLETDIIDHPIRLALDFRQRHILELLIAHNSNLPKNFYPEDLQKYLQIPDCSAILFYLIINVASNHIKELIKNRGIIRSQFFDTDSEGNTALMWAVIGSDQTILNDLIYYCFHNDILPFLDHENKHGESIYDLAKKYNRIKQLESLTNYTRASTAKVLSKFIQPKVAKLISQYVA